jgi:endonuclease YncB( thermonuclease family)
LALDRYKRLVAICYLGKTNINEWLVLNGYALAHIKYGGMNFSSAQENAKKYKRGIWAGEFKAPWEYRKSKI